MTRAADVTRYSPRRVFRDRREAGRVLADLLSAYRGRQDVIVLGLARGGMPVAWEVAAALHAPLDAFIVRKLGAPVMKSLRLARWRVGGASWSTMMWCGACASRRRNCAPSPSVKGANWFGARPRIAVDAHR